MAYMSSITLIMRVQSHYIAIAFGYEGPVACDKVM